MIKVKNFEEYPYVREEKSYSFQKRAIYKYSPASQLFYLVTPTNDKFNKVKTLDEISTLIRQHKVVQYKKTPNIYQAINKAWENWDEDWEYEGCFYSTNSHAPISDAPRHEVQRTICRIGYYHGRMVWVYMKPDSHVRYCNFISIDVAPDWSTGGWTNKRNIHPIFNNVTNKYI